MKLLIVEDEETILSALEKGFEMLGYAVDTAIDGDSALEMYFSNEYDLILLDLNLPGIDGIDILKEIRKENKDLPVLILSARTEIEDKITGLDLGANDYVEKPFNFKELDARVRALLRRDFETLDKKLEYKGIEVDTGLKKVFYKEEEIELTNKEYGILEYLFFNLERVVSGEELIEHVWDNEVDSFTSSFKVHISTLRKKLPFNIIKNSRGQGYYVE